MSHSLSGNAKIAFRVHATISYSYAGTNRCGQADETFGRVQKWAHLQSPADLQADALFEEVLRAIQSVQLAKTPRLHLFRGRIPPFASEQPAREEMGPPPISYATSGRYNGQGESVLYLCSTPEGVRREVSPSGGQRWIQSFEIDTKKLRIADFLASEVSARHLLNCVLLFSELAGAQGYPSTVFSQFVGSLVAESFDAMLVPGVHGDESVQYSNVVVFKPAGVWPEWLSLEEPRPL